VKVGALERKGFRYGLARTASQPQHSEENSAQKKSYCDDDAVAAKDQTTVMTDA
jgi:hypothetical protein